MPCLRPVPRPNPPAWRKDNTRNPSCNWPVSRDPGWTGSSPFIFLRAPAHLLRIQEGSDCVRLLDTRRRQPKAFAFTNHQAALQEPMQIGKILQNNRAKISLIFNGAQAIDL